MHHLDTALDPIVALALVGLVGVGAQWLAFRIQMPAIVLMLVGGILLGPVTGIFIPVRDIGPLLGPMISIAVAVILFEGGLSLNLHELGDARGGVKRLVVIGAPLGWLSSTLALHYGAGLGWESATVFGGIMIVTGPTVIAPLLRQARLAQRPAALLQWEAIVNDPIGALAAVLAFAFVQVQYETTNAVAAVEHFSIGIIFATLLGLAVGRGLAEAFRRALVPEYMKVSVLFVLVLVVFAGSNWVMHESGLLAVTVMGLVIANAQLPSYIELRRFKEHATILLVSGVFILLAAGLDLKALEALDWRTALFVAVVIGIARPLPVLISLIGSDIPMRERLLVAFTGPRGVVLMAVAGLFGEKLHDLGVADGDKIAPIAFVLVASTVVLHGFGLTPLARALGLRASENPGVLLVGGAQFNTELGLALKALDVPVLVTEANPGRLIRPRNAGLPVFYGDILSEAAETHVAFLGYKIILAATDNDAYNTLVTTDLAPEFGRENVWQLGRARAGNARHALPVTLGGRMLGQGHSIEEYNKRLAEGWTIRTSRLTDAFSFDDWREKRPLAELLVRVSASGSVRLLQEGDKVRNLAGTRLISLVPPDAAPEEAASDESEASATAQSGQPNQA